MFFLGVKLLAGLNQGPGGKVEGPRIGAHEVKIFSGLLGPLSLEKPGNRLSILNDLLVLSTRA